MKMSFNLGAIKPFSSNVQIMDKLGSWLPVGYLVTSKMFEKHVWKSDILKVVFATFLLVSFVCLKESIFETRRNCF